MTEWGARGRFPAGCFQPFLPPGRQAVVGGALHSFPRWSDFTAKYNCWRGSSLATTPPATAPRRTSLPGGEEAASPGLPAHT